MHIETWKDKKGQKVLIYDTDVGRPRKNNVYGNKINEYKG